MVLIPTEGPIASNESAAKAMNKGSLDYTDSRAIEKRFAMISKRLVRVLSRRGHR